MAERQTDTESREAGALEIGDQWNAINIIARSQTHPLKAVCELVENAIDAGGQHIHIVRRRSKEGNFLEVHDDGDGVVLNESGEPDFAHIATHVCDSMKRHLIGDSRSGIHGEFGIGLLSFWSIGEELLMASPDRKGATFEMALERNRPEYHVRRVRGELPMGGTRIQVGPLLDATRNVLTGDKIQRYLASELRDRIRKTAIEIKISDRIARKEWVVTPREYDGELLSELSDLETDHGVIHVELYLPGDRSSGVSVCKDGTRVLPNISELDQFQRAPWNDGSIEGLIDFSALNLAPGTRSGIVPDDVLSVFIESIESIEDTIRSVVEKRQRAKSEKASQEILKQVQRAFVNALRELPREDYVFFDLPRGARGLGRGYSTSVHGAELKGPSRPSQKVPMLPIPAGPLENVRITPNSTRRETQQNATFVAKPRDEHGFLVTETVHYEWKVVEGNAQLTASGNHAVVSSDQFGLTVVEVTARQGEVETKDTAEFRCVKNSQGAESSKGLPDYRLRSDPSNSNRSFYDEKSNAIIINSAHRDFAAARSNAAKYRRYIGKLYAKEVVLTNFPHENASQVMERLVEVLLRTEDGL